jgi:4-amino-4-deoxychorismate lyase
MSRLIESVKLLDGRFHNLFYHEQRMRTALENLFGVRTDINLKGFLKELTFPKQGLYKCRIVYDDHTREVEFLPYVQKTVDTLRVVESHDISYGYKFADRTEINRLYEIKNGCDDILIIKENRVTDSSYCNIVFKRNGTWATPQAPLLRGTMRQYLLDQRIIQEEDIRKGDIPSFECFKLINAMIGFEGPEMKISNIIF